MFRRYPTLAAALALFVLLAAWPGLASGQTYTLVSNTTFSQAPYKYMGALISINATAYQFPYAVGSGAIADDPRLVMSDAIITYGGGTTNATVLTQNNRFAVGYSNTTIPGATAGVKLRGFIYTTRYAQLATTGNLFTVTTLLTSFAVFYSVTPLISGSVPSVVTIAGGNLGTSVTKNIVGYAGNDYQLYQTGNFTQAPLVASDPLWYFPTPTPPLFLPPYPFIGSALWLRNSGNWTYEGVGLVNGNEVPNAASTATLTGTCVQLMNSSSVGQIDSALTALGNDKGPPRPAVNATNIYTTLLQGKIVKGYQHIRITNAGNGTLKFTSSSTATWLTVSPPTGTVTTQSFPMALNYDTTGLAVGNYSSTLKISNANGFKNIAVALDVAPVLPPAPTRMRATSNRTDGILVSWAPVSVAVKYRVFRGLSPQATNLTELNSTTDTSILDTSAVALQPYYYFTKTVGASYPSNFSIHARGEKRP